jgi:hypothetical protein
MPNLVTKYRPHLDLDDDVPAFISALTIAAETNQLDSLHHTTIINWLDIFEERYELYRIRKIRHEAQQKVRDEQQQVTRIRPPE